MDVKTENECNYIGSELIKNQYDIALNRIKEKMFNKRV